jgi:hypothetical protein
MLTAAIAAAKMSFETFAMISFSAFDAQEIGLHRHKFHHTFLSNMQSRYRAIAWQRGEDCGEYRQSCCRKQHAA